MLQLTCRLRDELRAKTKEADRQAQEFTTLKSALASEKRNVKAAGAAVQSQPSTAPL